MPHGQSWLSYIPGYHEMEHAIQELGPSWAFKGVVHAQHLAAILLTALIMLLLALRARGLHRFSLGQVALELVFPLRLARKRLELLIPLRLLLADMTLKRFLLRASPLLGLLFKAQRFL